MVAPAEVVLGPTAADTEVAAEFVAVVDSLEIVWAEVALGTENQMADIDPETFGMGQVNLVTGQEVNNTTVVVSGPEMALVDEVLHAAVVPQV